MHVLFVACMVAVCLTLLALVVKMFIQAAKNAIKYAAEARIEELQERHEQELYMKDKHIKYLEYCCTHPCIEISIFEFKKEEENI